MSNSPSPFVLRKRAKRGLLSSLSEHSFHEWTEFQVQGRLDGPELFSRTSDWRGSCDAILKVLIRKSKCLPDSPALAQSSAHQTALQGALTAYQSADEGGKVTHAKGHFLRVGWIRMHGKHQVQSFKWRLLILPAEARSQGTRS